MLLKLRGGLDHFLVTILLGVLIAAFAIWGVGPGMLNSATNTVATVGSTDVPTAKYVNAVQRRAQNLQQQFGGQFDTAQIINLMRIDQQILNQMVAEAAVKEHSNGLGLRVVPSVVAKELRQLGAFNLPDGTFSPELMRQMLAQNAITEDELIDDLRASLIRQQLTAAITANAPVPYDLAEQLYIWQAERRKASMINITADDITDIPTATEEDLQAEYDATKSSFMTPERRSYHYILLTPDNFLDQVVLSEEDILAAYDERRDEYVQEELRAIQQVTLPSEEAALVLRDTILSGDEFVEAAVAASEFTASELELGDLSYQDIVQDFGAGAADDVFGLSDGAISEIHRSVAGWNIFRVVGITEGAEQTLEQVRDLLTQAVKRDYATDLLYDFMPEIEDVLAAEGNIRTVAEKLSLNLVEATALDNQGRNEEFVQTINGTNTARIHQAAFAGEVGIEAELTDLNPADTSDGTYLLEVTDVIDPAQIPFEDVRADIISGWQTKKRLAKAGELAEQAANRLRAGEEYESISESMGGTAFSARNVTRTPSEESTLDGAIRNLIFSLQKGEIDIERASDNNGYVIVRVDDITPGNPIRAAGKVSELDATIKAQFSDDLFAQYQAYLLQRFEPSINYGIVEANFSRDNE